MARLKKNTKQKTTTNIERLQKKELTQFFERELEEYRALIKNEIENGPRLLTKVLLASGNKELISLYTSAEPGKISAKLTTDDWKLILTFIKQQNDTEAINYLLDNFADHIFSSPDALTIFALLCQAPSNSINNILDRAYTIQPVLVKLYACYLIIQKDQAIIEVIKRFPETWHSQDGNVPSIASFLIFNEINTKKQDGDFYSKLYCKIHESLLTQKRGPAKSEKEKVLIKKIAASEHNTRLKEFKIVVMQEVLRFEAIEPAINQFNVLEKFEQITHISIQLVQRELKLFAFYTDQDQTQKNIDSAVKLIKNICKFKKIVDLDLLKDAIKIYMAAGFTPNAKNFRDFWQSHGVKVSNDLTKQMLIANGLSYQSLESRLKKYAIKNAREAIDIYQKLTTLQQNDLEEEFYYAQYNLLSSLDMNSTEARQLLAKIAKRSKSNDDDLLHFVNKFLQNHIHDLAIQCVDHISDPDLKKYMLSFVSWCLGKSSISEIYETDQMLFEIIQNRFEKQHKIPSLSILQNFHNTIIINLNNDISVNYYLDQHINNQNLTGLLLFFIQTKIYNKNQDSLFYNSNKELALQMLELIKNEQIDNWPGVDVSMILSFKIIVNIALKQYEESKALIEEFNDKMSLSAIYKEHLISFLIRALCDCAIVKNEYSEFFLAKAQELAGKNKKYKQKLESLEKVIICIKDYLSQLLNKNSVDESSTDVDQPSFMTKQEADELSFDDLVKYIDALENNHAVEKLIHPQDYYRLLNRFYVQQEEKELTNCIQEKNDQCSWQYKNNIIDKESTIIYPITYKQQTLFAAIEPKLFDSLDYAFQIAARRSLSKGTIDNKSVGVNGVKFIGSLAEIKTSFSDRLVASEVIYNESGIPLLIFSDQMTHKEIKKCNEVGAHVSGLEAFATSYHSNLVDEYKWEEVDLAGDI